MLGLLLGLALSPAAAQPAAGPAPPQATLVLAGDILPHLSLQRAARRADGSYDFRPLFQPVRPLLTGADLAVASLETCLAGATYGYHGYPRFNAPDALADDLRAIGLDAVAAANNHSLDFGAAGVQRTAAALAAAELPPAGLPPAGAGQPPLILDAAGVRVALLSYTTFTNRPPAGDSETTAVAFLDPLRVAADCAEARQAGADVVVAYLHWGREYAAEPSPPQVELAHRLCTAGVDILVGTHPHVVQPLEWYTPPLSPDGQPAGAAPRRCLIAYSLGNFASGQRGGQRDVGVVLAVEVRVKGTAARLATVRYTAVVMRWGLLAGRRWCQVVPVEPASALALCPRPTLWEEWWCAQAQAWADWRLNTPAVDSSQGWAELGG